MTRGRSSSKGSNREDSTPKIQESPQKKQQQGSAKIEFNQKSSLFSSLSGISRISFSNRRKSDKHSRNNTELPFNNPTTSTRTESSVGVGAFKLGGERLAKTSLTSSFKSSHSRQPSYGLVADNMKYRPSTRIAAIDLKSQLKDIDSLVEKSVVNKYTAIFKKRKNSNKSFIELQMQTYYMKNLEYHLKVDITSDYSKKTKKHMLDTFASFKYISTVRRPSDETIAKSKFQCAMLQNTSKKLTFTIIFDLEDTLVHISETLPNAEVFIPVVTQDKKNKKLGLFKRPFIKEAISKLKDLNCEIFVWSSGSTEYANKIIDYIDPENEYFSMRLFRDQCYVSHKGLYIKDMRMINRDMDKCLIIDDHAYSFGFQISNGILILPYEGESTDTDLLTVASYVEYLLSTSDARQANNRHMRYDIYDKSTTVDDLTTKLINK